MAREVKTVNVETAIVQQAEMTTLVKANGKDSKDRRRQKVLLDSGAFIS